MNYRVLGAISFATFCLGATCGPPTPGACPKPVMQLYDLGDTHLSMQLIGTLSSSCQPFLSASEGTVHLGDTSFQPTPIFNNKTIATVISLKPETDYKLTAFYKDTNGIPTHGDTLTCRTDKIDDNSSPKVYGTVPANQDPTAAVTIEGRGFAALGGIAVDQIDTLTCERTALIPSRIGDTRVSVTLRASPNREYRIYGRGWRETLPEAAAIKTRGAYTNPTGKLLITRYIKWEPAAWCWDVGHDQYGNEVTCLCRLSDRFEENTRIRLGKPSDPDDRWTNWRWWTFWDVAKDVAREWATICSEIWGAPSNVRIAGTTLPRDPVTLYSGFHAAQNIDYNSRTMERLAKGTREVPCMGAGLPGTGTYCAPESGTPSFCSSSTVTPDYFETGHSPHHFNVPPDCQNYTSADRGGELVIHRVVVITTGSDNAPREVEPTVSRGVCSPENAYTDTTGVCIVSDNEERGTRWNDSNGFFKLKTYDDDKGGVPTTIVDAPCADHWADSNHPINSDLWAQYRRSEAPGNAPHQVVKPLFHYTPTSTSPALSIGVIHPTASNPRGFQSNLGGRHVTENCSLATGDLATTQSLDDTIY